MRNSLQKRLFKEGWTGKQVSAFLEKHGITRSWKTILEDIKNSKRVFLVEKISGYVILSDDTVKKYINFIVRTKKIKKKDGSMADADNLVRGIDAKTKERLDEGIREEKSKEDVFRGEIVDSFGSVEDRIVSRNGSIKMVRRF
ncbi:MAG: hypothetical protein AAB569_02315 [Patescibacteria group bacterium]